MVFVDSVIQSSKIAVDVFAYGERLNPEPISTLYKDKELDEKSSDTVSEESMLLLANMPQNIN